MEKNIAIQNAERLSNLSTAFFVINSLPDDAGLIHAFSQMIMSAIGRWYMENEGRIFNPQTEIIGDEAIKFAFGQAQGIAVLASITAQVGMGM